MGDVLHFALEWQLVQGLLYFGLRKVRNILLFIVICCRLKIIHYSREVRKFNCRFLFFLDNIVILL